MSKCKNSANGEHKKVHNSAETHFVCAYCVAIFEPIPEEEKRAVPAWRREAQKEYKY